MFALKSRKEMLTRTILSGVILFNAITPITGVANLADAENQISSDKQQISLQNPDYRPVILSQPSPRMGERPQSPNDSQQGLTLGTTLICNTSGLCSDPGPSVVLVEEVNGSNQETLYFSIQCPAFPCASRDIFWHVSMDF